MEKQTEEKTFEELLGEAAENAEMVNGKPFARLIEVLSDWEYEAHEKMLGNQSPQLAWAFQQLWIQRRDLLNGVRAWADAQIKQKENLIEQLRQEQLEIA